MDETAKERTKRLQSKNLGKVLEESHGLDFLKIDCPDEEILKKICEDEGL